MRVHRSLLLSALLLLPAVASAVGLTKVSETSPWPGVTVRKYRTSSPSADAWAVLVDLCSAGIHVDSTVYTGSAATTGSFAQSAGAQVATNADFYKSGPNRVYGQAVGEGVPWPVSATGFDPAYATEWYYKKPGWIAFGHDWVQFNHTKQVKQNPGGRTLGGWLPTTVTGTFPPDTLGLASGFPELVTEGVRVTCSSPTASSCFPDRSDMRARHPRTAMGLTQDLQTFILLVVDGRTSTSAGMYGTELAETMGKLGAWQAFNLDGGGSSQLWRQGAGYLNNYNGNNSGNGARAILNHWGIFAGSGSGKPGRAGHCVSAAPCQVIAPSGGTVDNASACFRSFGPPATWRPVQSGSGGSLVWTNAIGGSRPENWAWWQLDLQAEGDYRVEFYAEGAYAKFANTRYEVYADGKSHPLTVNQGASTGWRSLGVFHFAAGGGQFVRLFDNNPSVTVPSGQRISADAVRLVPAGPQCGDGTCNGTEACGSCPADCGACPACGDGACNGAETCATCAADCGSCCGNGQCDEGETCAACASDCGACPTCGDGTCGASEDCERCPADCGSCCGNGACDAEEDCARCAADCGSCGSCGDGDCRGTESCGSCPDDCGACDAGEPCDGCGTGGSADDGGTDGGGKDGGSGSVPSPEPGGCSSAPMRNVWVLLVAATWAVRRRRAAQARR
jgi:hypothetical protein